MWKWIENRRRRSILRFVGLQNGFLGLAHDLHWTHGMLDTFPTCTNFRCVHAREILAHWREVGEFGSDINKSVNLWNDNDELREFIKRLLAQIQVVATEKKSGASPAVDKLQVIAANPPFALHWEEKPRKERYG